MDICFCLFAIMNNAAKNIHVQLFVLKEWSADTCYNVDEYGAGHKGVSIETEIRLVVAKSQRRRRWGVTA